MRKLAVFAVALFGAAGCSSISSTLPEDGAGPTVGGVTTIKPPAVETTVAPATTSSSLVEPTADTAPVRATGLSKPILIFGNGQLDLVDPSGRRELLHSGAAVRVEGDLNGGVVFQEGLVNSSDSAIRWRSAGSDESRVIVSPPPDRRVTLHGVADVGNGPEAVFSTEGEGEPGQRTDQLSRINLGTETITNLATVTGEEFGSRSTQVDGQFIVTTWRNERAAGWTVYQARSGQQIGGSVAALDQTCTAFPEDTCAALAAISANGVRVFRILPKSADAAPGQYRLVVSKAENGQQLYDIDLENGTQWWPEHVVQVGPNTVLLSRAATEDRFSPTTGLVIDLISGQSAEIDLTGFVRLPAN